MRLNEVIIKPIVTEKSMQLAGIGQYVFEVALSASDGQVIREIKSLYNVDATQVRSSILPGKKRRIAKTQRFKKTSKRKKVMVTLKEGQKLDLMPKE